MQLGSALGVEFCSPLNKIIIMIQFKNKVKGLLSYDRKQYKSLKNWFGVSFQLPGVFEGKDIGLDTFLDVYLPWFKSIISSFDSDIEWVVNHDYIDEFWFPNNHTNLKNLRLIFRQNKTPNQFIGGLILSSNELLELSQDILSYPYSVCNENGLLYNNLDISHSRLPLVFKISGHLNIDILSTDKEMLRRIVLENSDNIFILREYRGTEIL